MEFDYQLAKDIILISIPVVGAGLTARITTSNWQKRKEMSDIKRQILSDYEMSEKRRATLTSLFSYKIFQHYIDWNSIPQESDDTLKYLIFPKDEKEQPFQKFSIEYKKFLDDYDETSFAGSRFLSSLRFYYPNTMLLDLERQLESNIHDLRLAIRRIIHCKDESKFRELILLYVGMDKKNTKMIGEFENMLIRTPVKITNK